MSIELKSQYHLFRYASEWDPREKGKTKGGYLEGSIRLPHSEEGVRVEISTYPAHLPEGLEKECQYVHPTLIHLVRKTRARRMQELEPVPNIHHWKQELIVKGKQVDIVNRTSGADEGRNILPQDKLFDLKDEQVLPFGKEAGELNLIILIPKSDARAQGDDVTLKNLLSNRIDNKDILGRMDENYKGKKSVNLKQVKLRVEFYSLSDGSLISSDVSQTISDTASKQLGALDFHDATPLKSCEKGGRKVIMVAEFGLATDVEPRFQLFDHEGKRMKDKEDTWLNQPMNPNSQQQEKVVVFKESIIFITPEQPHLRMILDSGYKIMLGGRRKSDGHESRKRFHFTYVEHITNCFFCYLSPDGGEICQKGQAKLPLKKEGPRPGRKKRKMSETDIVDVDMEPISRQDSIASSHRTSTDSQITWSPNSDDSGAVAVGYETQKSGGNSQPIVQSYTFTIVPTPETTTSVGENENRVFGGGENNGISIQTFPKSQIYGTGGAFGSGQIDNNSINMCSNQAGNTHQSNIVQQKSQTGAIPKSNIPRGAFNIQSSENENIRIQEFFSLATQTTPQIQDSLTLPDQVWNINTVPSPPVESPNIPFNILSPENNTTSPLHSIENHQALQTYIENLTPMTNIDGTTCTNLDNHNGNIGGAMNADMLTLSDTTLSNPQESHLLRNTDGENLPIQLSNIPEDCVEMLGINSYDTDNYQEDMQLQWPLGDIVQDGSSPRNEIQSLNEKDEKTLRRVRLERRDTATHEEVEGNQVEGIREEDEQPGFIDRMLHKFRWLPGLFVLLFLAAKWYFGDSMEFAEVVITTLWASAIIIVVKDYFPNT